MWTYRVGRAQGRARGFSSQRGQVAAVWHGLVAPVPPAVHGEQPWQPPVQRALVLVLVLQF